MLEVPGDECQRLSIGAVSGSGQQKLVVQLSQFKLPRLGFVRRE
jgi:hypothetical protein